MTGMVSSAADRGPVHRVAAVEPVPVGAAGIASRTAANMIDFAVTASLLAGAYIGYATFRFLLRPRAFSFPAPSLLLVIIAGSVLSGLYLAVCGATTGRTYGDLVLGLRVITRGRDHLRPVTAILRAAACVLIPVGLAWSGIDRRRGCCQDILLRPPVFYAGPGSR